MNEVEKMYENAGINAVILNENTPIWAGVCNSDLLGIELVVSDEDYSEACMLIAAASNAE